VALIIIILIIIILIIMIMPLVAPSPRTEEAIQWQSARNRMGLKRRMRRPDATGRIVGVVQCHCWGNSRAKGLPHVRRGKETARGVLVISAHPSFQDRTAPRKIAFGASPLLIAPLVIPPPTPLLIPWEVCSPGIAEVGWM